MCGRRGGVCLLLMLFHQLLTESQDAAVCEISGFGE